MYWHRRTITRLMLLLMGSAMLCIEWLANVGNNYARLTLRPSAYSADPDLESAPDPTTYYYQQPYYQERYLSGRQSPDYLGLDISLLHQGPYRGGEWVPAGRYVDGWQDRSQAQNGNYSLNAGNLSDEELLSLPFWLPELEAGNVGESGNDSLETSTLPD